MGCEPAHQLDYRLDYWTLMTAALGPVLLWHATPTRRFDWFGFGEDFVVRLPESAQPLGDDRLLPRFLGPAAGQPGYTLRTTHDGRGG